MNITINLTDKQLTELEDLLKELHKTYSFHVLDKHQYLVAVDLLSKIMDQTLSIKTYKKFQELNLDCQTCQHSVDWHSKVGERICSKMSCECMNYIIKTNDN